jgi:hypothetical protein
MESSLVFMGMPFLPCYDAAGYHIQFYALSPSLDGHGKPICHVVSEVFNIGTELGGLWVMRIAVNLMRVFAALRRLAPTKSLFKLNFPHPRREPDCSITIMSDPAMSSRC